MVLQIPVFFALYQLLMRFISLRGANFLWIKDLSAPDRLFIFPKSLPIIGNELNILPILMMVVMFFQQKFTMPQMAGTKQSADQQKMMAIYLLISLGIHFLTMQKMNS